VKILRRLAGRQPRVQDEEEYFVSAVLVPLVETAGKLHLLFEVRSNHLQRQPGEICFPGGRVEQGELASPQDTAIREAVEELGISREQVVLLGPLDYLVTPPGTLIYPYVGLIEEYKGVNPNPEEVEKIFLAPLEHFFRNPPFTSKVEVATRYARDFPYHRVPSLYYKEGWQARWTFTVYFYEYGDYFIWGVTARILHNFISLCLSDHAAG